MFYFKWRQISKENSPQVPLLKGLGAWSCKRFDPQIIFCKCAKSLCHAFPELHLLQLHIFQAELAAIHLWWFIWLVFAWFAEPWLACSSVHLFEPTLETWNRCSYICDYILTKQHTLVTYSIFKLQIKISVVCLKLSLFLWKEKETHQSCLRVRWVNTDVNGASESASRLLEGSDTVNWRSVPRAPCQGPGVGWWHWWSCAVDWYHGTLNAMEQVSSTHHSLQCQCLDRLFTFWVGVPT